MLIDAIFVLSKKKLSSSSHPLHQDKISVGAPLLSFWDYLGKSPLQDTLLSWKGFRVLRKMKKVWQASPLCLFWTMWKVRNMVAFKDEVLSLQRLKCSFVFLLWSETELSIVGGPSTLIGFIDRVGCK